jgi:polyphosphate kinase 2 (PPK2 family)
MVERVEALTPDHRWQDAYQEINDFERMLVDDGVRIVKLFFHISPEVQMQRFSERLRNPMKRWKLTYEDFRNRGKWADYESAINEMFVRTSTDIAPWTVIAANHKKYARIAAMKRILDVLAKGVDLGPRQMEDRLLDEAGKHLDVDKKLIKSLRGRTD